MLQCADIAGPRSPANQNIVPVVEISAHAPERFKMLRVLIREADGGFEILPGKSITASNMRRTPLA